MDDPRASVDELLAAGQTQKAVRAAQALVARGQDDRDTQLLLGRALERTGQWRAAMKVYKRLAAQDRDDELAASLFATAREEDAGNTEAALALREQLAQSAPDDSSTAAALDAARIRARVLSGIEDANGPDLRAWNEAIAGGQVDQALVAGALAAALRQENADLALRVLADAPRMQLEPPIADHLRALLAQSDAAGTQLVRRLVEELPAVKPGGWQRLFKPLVLSARYDLARALVEALASLHKPSAAIEQMQTVASRLPAEPKHAVTASRELPPDDPLTVLRTPKARATVLVFSSKDGLAQAVDAPLASRAVDVVHLRAVSPSLLLLDGIPDIAADYRSAIERVREIVDQGPRPLYAIGHSALALTAMRYGIDLEADGIMALNPPTNLSAGFMERDGRRPRTYRKLRERAPEVLVNMADVLRAMPDPPRIWLYYNAGHTKDAAHAKELEGVPGVSLHAVPRRSEHNVLFSMIELDLFESALDNLLGSVR